MQGVKLQKKTKGGGRQLDMAACGTSAISWSCLQHFAAGAVRGKIDIENFWR